MNYTNERKQTDVLAVMSSAPEEWWCNTQIVSRVRWKKSASAKKSAVNTTITLLLNRKEIEKKKRGGVPWYRITQKGLERSGVKAAKANVKKTSAHHPNLTPKTRPVPVPSKVVQPPHLSHGGVTPGAWSVEPSWSVVIGEGRELKMHCKPCFEGDECEMCADLREQLNNLPTETNP